MFALCTASLCIHLYKGQHGWQQHTVTTIVKKTNRKRVEETTMSSINSTSRCGLMCVGGSVGVDVGRWLGAGEIVGWGDIDGAGVG